MTDPGVDQPGSQSDASTVSDPDTDVADVHSIADAFQQQGLDRWLSTDVFLGTAEHRPPSQLAPANGSAQQVRDHPGSNHGSIPFNFGSHQAESPTTPFFTPSSSGVGSRGGGSSGRARGGRARGTRISASPTSRPQHSQPPPTAPAMQRDPANASTTHEQQGLTGQSTASPLKRPARQRKPNSLLGSPPSKPAAASSAAATKRSTARAPARPARPQKATPVIDLGNGCSFRIPPFYDELAAAGLVPGLEDLVLDDEILRGAITTITLADLQAQEQRRVAERLARNGTRLRQAGVPSAGPGAATELAAGSQLTSAAAQATVEAAPPQSAAASAANGKRQRAAGVTATAAAPKRRKKGDEDAGAALRSTPGPEEGGHTPETKRETTPGAPAVKAEEAAPQLPEFHPEGWDKMQAKQREAFKKRALTDPALAVQVQDVELRQAWVAMARRDIPRAQRALLAGHKASRMDARKLAEGAKKEMKAKEARLAREAAKAAQQMRKLSRDMLVWWKKAGKEAAEARRQEERDAAEARRKAEEAREQRRQAQRLNFLITQTELYSHFMSHKMGMTSKEDAPAAGGEGAAAAGMLGEDAEEEAALREEARQRAEAAVLSTAQRMEQFDADFRVAQQKAGVEGAAPDARAPAPFAAIPSGAATIAQPRGFRGSLKGYQLKGLQWLVNLYDQGLNGILADEMGLGKTVQAISFMAHLSEEKHIWGPFLVVAPASTLHNWDQELHQFCPMFKVLPYWGSQADRKMLRRNFHPRKMYSRQAAFHVVVTSYQIVVQDEAHLRRVKWQYMILDEAQAIKSSSSQRWKTLLDFSCRNRILLTGTPVQNSMQELWALLHFIMPSLFDSQEHFNEWFSKGLEGYAEGSAELNEEQLKRLHAIMSPFMLRRIKADVIEEMVRKEEHVVYCPMNRRQQQLYKAIRDNLNLADLFNSDEKHVVNLMNLVIQLRKVCNHPELFEEQSERVPLYFASVPPPLAPPAFGQRAWAWFSGRRSALAFRLPKLLFREGMTALWPGQAGHLDSLKPRWLDHQLNIFEPSNVHTSLFGEDPSWRPLPQDCGQPSTSDHAGADIPAGRGRGRAPSAFGFSRLIGLCPGELQAIALADPLQRWEVHRATHRRNRDLGTHWREQLAGDEAARPGSAARQRLLLLELPGSCRSLRQPHRWGAAGIEAGPLVATAGWRLGRMADLMRSVRGVVEAVMAPPPAVLCSDRLFQQQQEDREASPWLQQLLSGISSRPRPWHPPAGTPPLLLELATRRLTARGRHQLSPPLLDPLFRVVGAAPFMQQYALAKALVDSGKLLKLDELLRKLKGEGHRVLMFCQMTMMMNILEDYLKFRKHKFLRLDGSSSIAERRDMVRAFQAPGSDIFVFMLSTRAGGLGINLTAADTVIFYESDWNPTMDLQAMDRAHRLGQTRDVSVYRLICKNTIEEKILQRAREKSTVQQLVMTGNASRGDVIGADEVASLLMDDMDTAAAAAAVRAATSNRKAGAAVQLRFNEEGSGVGIAADGDDPAPAADGQPDAELAGVAEDKPGKGKTRKKRAPAPSSAGKATPSKKRKTTGASFMKKGNQRPMLAPGPVS